VHPCTLLHRLSLFVDLASGLTEFNGFLLHALLKSLRFRQLLAGGVVADFLGDLHRAEVGTTHTTKVSEFRSLLRQRFVVEFLRLLRIEAEVELIAPAELEARLAKRVVAQLRAGVALGEVGGVRR